MIIVYMDLPSQYHRIIIVRGLSQIELADSYHHSDSKGGGGGLAGFDADFLLTLIVDQQLVLIHEL